MSYLGRGTDKISNIEILDNITFDGSSSYSITKSSVAFTPNSAQSLLISIDGVVQATNFTVSSSTIDFGVAVPSTSTCDFFLHYGTGLITIPADGTVSLAKLSATGTKDATTFLRGDNSFSSLPASGITMADQWRLTSDFSGNATPISSNLEQVDTSGQGTLGSAMTESSGVFSFPSTGIYLVKFIHNYFYNGTNQYSQARIGVTTNNSSFTKVAESNQAVTNQSQNAYVMSISESLVDVTDTTNVKVRFEVSSQQTITTRGNSGANYTNFTFIRLGDT
jgi:hypothetical protein